MSTDEIGSGDPLSLEGVIPPTITAFDAEESVDYETTAAHARFVVDRGVDAVFPLGTNGEFALLTDEERAGVIESVVEEVGGDVPVIAGVGAPSTYRTVENARRAAEVGADGVVVVTPYYYPLDGEGAVSHYRRVAEAVDVPVYIYHIPGRTGNALALDTLAGIASIEGVAGLKDSSKDVPWLGQAIAANPELTFLVGSDSLQFVGRALGCTGGVSAVANAVPEIVVELHDAYNAGERDRARTIQEELYEIRGAFKSGSYMAGVKSALSLRGFDAGPLREPLRRMSEGEERDLETRLQDLDVL
ncbi:dihydrodipicolinate synthase family protein [Halobacteriales archaeon QH_8_64_26]|nr:MAG: dihydrodipicolinate synthase family protein [Halobacteriales archaeon QH_8_64_26]